IAVLLSCLLYYLLEELLKKNKSLIHIAFTSGAILLMLLPALFLKNFSWVSEQPSTVLRFHLVQGNIPQHDKWLPENQRQILIIFNDLIQETFLNIQTEQLEDQKTGINRQHVIVLPEAAMPTLQSELSWFFDE